MTQPSQNIVDLFYTVDEEQFVRILARVATSVANSNFKQHFTINEIYNHVEFKDGDITNLHVQSLILVY